MKLNNIIDLNSYIRISSIRETFEKSCVYVSNFDEVDKLDIYNCNNIIFENTHIKNTFFERLNLTDTNYVVINCLSSIDIFKEAMHDPKGIVVFDNVCSCRNNDILEIVTNYKGKKVLVC